ncbi:MAG: ATP-binding protein, partial [Propionibacteriaceae bacterium]|nr:ATP-binding protein [Propionibacteriaceae bacterium]
MLSNVVFTGLTWFQTATYFHPGVNAVALLVVMASASWLILRVGKRILDRRDVLAVILAQATASLALAVTPHTGPSSGASIWTQGWSVTSVCAAMLLFPRVTGGLLVALSSLSYALVRFTEVRPVIALIEAAIPVLGATVVTWAAHATSSRYREAQVAAEVAAARAEAAEEARAREQARDWWKRILHDKVIGALLLASRATATSQLAQARHLAQDALETLDTIEELDADRQDAHLDLPLTVSAQDDLHIPLTDRLYRTAVRHGLLPDVSEGWTLAGSSRSIPPAVAEAILAAADQVFSNVARHSRTTTVAVRVTQSPTQVTVRVRDDGVGFDPSAVDTRRQGLSVSLPGHMALVSGSSAVQSALGKGTTVTLKWQAADSTVGLTNVTAEQVRAWWWVTALFASLHLGACWFSGLPIAVGVVGWTGLAVWLIGMGL